MTMVHTQFLEKKYRSFFDGTASEFQGQNFPYILFFQVNHINSKEWNSLKNTFYQKSPSTIHHMIPKRFLVQILQPDVFPQKTHSLFSFLEHHNSFQDTKSMISSKSSQSGPLQGHSCFFFCQTLQEVQKFFQNSHDALLDSQQTPFHFPDEDPLVLSKTFWTKSQQKRFIPLGLFEKLQTSNFSFLYWNPYDVQKLLRVTSEKVSPHQQLITQVLYPVMTQSFHIFHQFSSFGTHGIYSPFLYHHYELYTLLVMFSLKKTNQSN